MAAPHPPLWYRPSDWSYLARRRAVALLCVLAAPLAAAGIYWLTLALWVHFRPPLWVRYELRPNGDGTVRWRVEERTDDAGSRLLLRAADGTEQTPSTDGGWGRTGLRWGYSTGVAIETDDRFTQPLPIAAEGRWASLGRGEERELVDLTRPDGVAVRLVIEYDPAPLPAPGFVLVEQAEAAPAGAAGD